MNESNAVSPELERIAQKAAVLIYEHYKEGISYEIGEENYSVAIGWIKRTILEALALQVEKEKKETLGSETPLPLGQQPEETNGNPSERDVAVARTQLEMDRAYLDKAKTDAEIGYEQI
jgi:hypothetical protein